MRWLSRVLIVIGSLFGLMLASGLVLKMLVSGSAKDSLAASLSEKLGAQVTVASAGFDLMQWFRLRPAVTLESVVIANPPGFGPRPLIEAKGISAQVALLPLLQKRIQVHSIIIDNPRFQLDTNARGVTNLDVVIKNLSGQPSSASSGSGPAFEVDKLTINNGVLATTGETKPVASDIDIRVHDFSGDRSCRLEVALTLFGGSNSRLKIDAHAGPFSADSIPLDGTLNLVIAPAEIPQDVRVKEFGALLGAPGDKARMTLDATIKGDLYRTLNAPAKLTLAGFLVGSGKHVMPLSGEFPATLTASNLMAESQIQVAVKNARLKVSKGEWSGDVDLRIRGPLTSGSSQGSIRNVDLDEFLSALTTAEGKLQGIAELSPYTLQFSGKNATEVRGSLRGTAKLAVTQGRIAALDLLASIEKTVGMLQQAPQGADAAKGTTPFTRLGANILVGESKMQINDLVLEGPTLAATGNGVIGFDHSLNFDLLAKVTGNTASLVNRVAFSSQSNEASVPLTVTGTVDAPRVRPNVGKVVKEQVTKQVKGLVESLFNRKK
ncbi:MAG TPA: AsmA family protein [Bryobacteraceae bacterium]|nr:AsmA family protein [Bryobacteraceae bacterium]